MYGRVKRKYTKRKHPHAGEQKKPTESKRGRKKRTADISPENVIDYIIQNYPHLGVDKIRDKVLVALKAPNGLYLPNYVLDVLEYKGVKYYYDMYGNILNANADNVGQYVDFGTEHKIYMYDEEFDCGNCF